MSWCLLLPPPELCDVAARLGEIHGIKPPPALSFPTLSSSSECHRVLQALCNLLPARKKRAIYPFQAEWGQPRQVWWGPQAEQLLCSPAGGTGDGLGWSCGWIWWDHMAGKGSGLNPACLGGSQSSGGEGSWCRVWGHFHPYKLLPIVLGSS